MLYPSAKFDGWLNWWIPSKVIDCKPKLWQSKIWPRRRRRRRWTHDSYVLILRLKMRVLLFEEGAWMQRIYINAVFATIKNYLLSLYCVRVLKPFRISHIKLGPLSWKNLTLSHVNNKGADQSAHRASLMRAFCNWLPGKYIAKQLNLAL